MALLRHLATSPLRARAHPHHAHEGRGLRPYAEKLITQAERDRDQLHARRLVAREIHDLTIVKKLFDDLGARYASRPGGYTRILRLGPRRGDGAEMAIVELLGSEYQPAKKDDKGKKTESEKKPAAKAAKAAKAPGGSRKARVAKSGGEEKAAGGKKKAAAKSGAKKKAASKDAE